MRTIHKYPVAVVDRFTLALPRGAEVLAVQMQQESPYLWAIVDTEAELERRVFRLVGTGHRLLPEEPGKYCGTFQMLNGSIVYHLFEAGRA